jgi:hypothetical protein
MRVNFQGSITSWTPSLDLCLELGGRYGWSVRATAHDGPSKWSPPWLFEVARGASPTELDGEVYAEFDGQVASGSCPAGTAAESVALVGTFETFGGDCVMQGPTQFPWVVVPQFGFGQGGDFTCTSSVETLLPNTCRCMAICR